MLSKEILDNISVVASVSGARCISKQNLQLLALKYGMTEEECNSAKEYCEQNRIAIYDEETVVENALQETTKDVEENPAGAISKTGELESFVDSLDYSNVPADQVEFCKEFLREVRLRNAQVIAFYYGLSDGKRHSIEETSVKFGISGSRVKQILGQRIHHFRCILKRSKRLKDYLNQ